jgi:hypothetical protein
MQHSSFAFVATRRLMRLARVCSAIALVVLSARAQIVHQTVVPADRESTPCVWFQAMTGPAASPAGHSGVLDLGSGVFGTPPLLYGAWLTFTPQGVFVTYVGGTTSTVQISDPGGVPLADIRGATLLASSFDLGIDSSTGSLYTVTLYSGVVLWNASHAYLLLLGGPPTTYELTDGGAPLADVKGAVRLAAQVPNTGTVLSPNYILYSGTFLYSGAKSWLTTTAGLIATSELTFGGASLPGVRGVTPMGGTATAAMLDSGSFFYDAARTYLLLTGPGASVYEVTTPTSASIGGAWGVVRLSPRYAGGGFFQGAAAVLDKGHEWLVLVGGGISVSEMTQASGASLISNVQPAAGNLLLHQATGLQEILAGWKSPSGATIRGTVLGHQQ